jgi:hypothetical protein
MVIIAAIAQNHLPLSEKTNGTKMVKYKAKK